MKTAYWRVIPLVLFLIIGLFLWKGLSLKPQELPSTQVGKTLPVFQLQNLNSDSEVKFTSSMLQGKTMLLNVWSSWCEACTEEQAFLLKLADRGVVIYGLNYKDKVSSARQWLQDWGNPYLASGSDVDGMVGFDLGVYGAPETFLIDKYGVIKYRYPGILNENVWQDKFLPLIKKLEDNS
ncbi:MAG: DsbE family thiol:disulfide interchange protein [Legionellaceae bacterium]|nr:DsbE family thiol:disulfide interchange protein [Legionellaceae bacterium]